MNIVPFFVADRPMSLRLLKSLPLQNYPDAHIGIMAHANTTLNFQDIFHAYPCDDINYCDAISGPCQFKSNNSECPTRRHILQHTIKMCDSGIFTREGAMLNYKQLFEAYVRMGVEYGIIIDVFRDSQATLKSAKEALQAYEPFKGQFELVGVAQGKSVKEYVQNYEDLKALGFTYVAIVGLLRKLENTARYAQVRDEDTMDGVLRTLRERYPEDWLFALGCFHPSRLEKFKELNVWGDYKGWIFQYEKRNETLKERLAVFASNHLKHVEVGNSQHATNLILTLQEKVKARSEVLTEQKTLSRQLFEGRRILKAFLVALYEEAQVKIPEVAKKLNAWTTHGLLSEGEEKQIIEALQSTGKYETDQGKSILNTIRKNRELKTQIESLENHLNEMNVSLAKDIANLREGPVSLEKDTEIFCSEIAELIESTERTHRFEQVRGKIVLKILELL